MVFIENKRTAYSVTDRKGCGVKREPTEKGTMPNRKLYGKGPK